MGERLLDREAEFDLVRGVLDDLRAGRSAVLVVEGRPGTGRSAFARSVAEIATRAGIRVVAGSCSPAESTVDWGVVSQLLAPLTPSPELLDRPSIGPLCREFLLRAAESPLLVVIDDAHWADPASVRWLQAVSRRMADTPVVLLLAVSSGADLADGRTVASHLLRLSPLSLPGVHAVLKQEFAVPVAPAFVVIAERATSGNPAVLRTVAGRLSAARVKPDIAAIPQLLSAVAEATSDLVSRTIDGLPDELVALLRAIAVCGRALDFDLVCSVAGLRARSVSQARAQLHRAGLITEGDRPVLADWVVSDRVLAGMPLTARESMHAEAARLGHHSAASDDGIAVILLGTRPLGESWVVDVLRRAAANSSAAGDTVAAARFLSRASREPSDVSRTAQVLVELGEVELRDAPGASDRHLGQVITGPGGFDVGPLRVRAADLLTAKGNIRLVRRTTGEACARSNLENRAEAQLRALHWLAEEGARDVVDGVGAPFRASMPEWPTDPSQAAATAWRLAIGGQDITRARALARAAVSHPSRTDWPTTPRIAACQALAVADDTVEAVAGLDMVVAEARLPADRVLAALALAVRAGIVLRDGLLDDASRDLAAAIDLVPMHCWHPRHAPSLVALRLMVHIERREYDRAEQIVADTPVDPQPDGVAWPHLLFVKGVLRLAVGEPAAAVELLLECGRQMLTRQAANPALLPWRSTAGVALAACGRIDQANALVVTERELALAWGAPRPVRAAQAVLDNLRPEVTEES